MILIKIDYLKRLLIIFFLWTAFLNAVLRISPAHSVTLFRLLLPVGIAYLAMYHTLQFKNFLLVSILLIVYGFLNSLYLGQYHSLQIAYFFHYLTLTFLFFFVAAIIKNEFNLVSFYAFLKITYIIMLVMGLLQLVFEYELPNTLYRKTINTFYYVENDFSAAIAIFMPLLLFERKGRAPNLLLFSIGFFFIIFNGSRIVVISLSLFLILLFWSKNRRIGSIIFVSAVAFFTPFIFSITIEGEPLSKLLAEPIVRIVNSKPYESPGSVYDRTNALIYGKIELFNSSGFGIGPGNSSAKMLQNPKYKLKTAESMHNFFAQIIVEYGWLMIIILVALILYVFKFRIRSPIYHNFLFLSYIATTLLTSLAQSEGLFSNYYFFIVLYFSFFFFSEDFYKQQTQKYLKLDSPSKLEVTKIKL